MLVSRVLVTHISPVIGQSNVRDRYAVADLCNIDWVDFSLSQRICWRKVCERKLSICFLSIFLVCWLLSFMNIKRLIRIFSMRRGGQHVFIDWLMEQLPGKVIFLNDVSPEESLSERLTHITDFDRFSCNGAVTYATPDSAETLIVNYEDWRLDEAFFSGVDVNMPVADVKINILLLRDPLNLFSSRYFFWARMPFNAERWQWNDTALWLNHASRFIEVSKTVHSGQMAVNFNQWVSDEKFRQALAKKLDVEFRDQALLRISHVGSQFDDEYSSEYASRLEKRWLYSADIPEYQELFTDDLMSLSGKIFGNQGDFYALRGIDVSPSPDINDVLYQLRQGNSTQAMKSAVRLCHLSPFHLPVWNLLAGVFAQKKRYADVVACCRKMLYLEPSNTQAKYNLALALQELGNFEEASQVYEDIISAGVDSASVAINLANIYIQKGSYERARSLLNAASGSEAAGLELLNTLGLLYMSEGHYQDAVGYFQKALSYSPVSASVTVNLCRCMAKAGNTNEALSLLRQFISTTGLDDHAVQVALACIYREAGMPKEAVSVLRREEESLRISLDCYTELGLALRDMYRYPEAEAAFEQALRYPHTYEVTLNNLGSICMLACEYDRAERYFREALSLKPAYAEAHWNLSFLLLTKGEFREGWKAYEWRFDYGVAERIELNGIKQWSGEDLADKSILLYTEQGYGDAVQFVRFVKLFPDNCKVTIQCNTLIGGFLKYADNVCEVVSMECEITADMEFDYYAPLMSVPYIMQVDSVPFSAQYVRPEYDHVSSGLKSMLNARSERLRVGVAWSGNPDYPDNQRRSFSVELFREIAEMDAVEVYSLQKGKPVEDIYSLGMDDVIIDLDLYNGTFIDTAYIISQMDMVITVDTVFAHIAGAMSKKAIVLLCYSPDWRWHTDFKSSRWYSSVGIIRQELPGDWGAVFVRLKELVDDMSGKKILQNRSSH